jgi:hypothetical protein
MRALHKTASQQDHKNSQRDHKNSVKEHKNPQIDEFGGFVFLRLSKIHI